MIRNAVLGCLVAAVILGGVEVALRLGGVAAVPATIPGGPPVEIRDHVVGDDWRGHHVLAGDLFVPDPRTLDDPDRSALWLPVDTAPFNADRVVGPRLRDPRPVGTLRVLTLGDSNTLADAETGWAAQLPEEWTPTPSCSSAEVINGGVHGYTSFQGLQRLPDLLAAEPDVVVLAFGWNDALQVQPVPDSAYADALRGWEAARRDRPPLALVSALADAIGTARARDLDRVPRVSPDDWLANHRAMAATIRAAGAQPVFATRPFDPVAMAREWDEEDPHAARVLAYADALRDLARELDVPLWDLARAVPAWPEPTWADSCHLSTDGHRRAARDLAALLSTLPPCREAADPEGDE